MLCVGLDTDFAKIPECVKAGRTVGEAVLEFNKRIIDATAPHCIAFKPNLAFYECLGVDGMAILDKTVDYIRSNHPEQFIIADAKRGDIGNTARMYAKSLFKERGDCLAAHIRGKGDGIEIKGLEEALGVHPGGVADVSPLRVRDDELLRMV